MNRVFIIDIPNYNLLQTLSENSPVSSKKMGGKRGKRKTDSEETATVEELATNENLTVDETKENGVENGAKIEVSPKKHCSKATVRILKNISIFLRTDDIGVFSGL